MLLATLFLLRSNSVTAAGIGAYLEECEGRHFVTRLIKNNPAAEAGLQVGDEIIQVNNKNVRDKTPRQITKLIVGNLGSRVKLLINRNNKKREISIERAKIQWSPHERRMLSTHVAYLRFSSNYAEIGEIKDIFSWFHENSAKALIFDFRSFGGLHGLKNDLYIIKIFSDGKTLGYKEDSEGKRTELRLKTKTIQQIIPVAILVNNGTAGGGEMITIAIREYGKAYVMGARTTGNTFTIREKSKIPTHRYISPNGVDIHQKGIEPDYVFSLEECGVVTDGVINEAVEYLERKLAR